MIDYLKLFKDTATTGALTAITTSAAVAACGQIETGNAIAPINAVSHIAWGDQAAQRERASWKYTAVGLALNAAAVTSWALIFEAIFGKQAEQHDVGMALVGGIGVSACAYVTDYHVVPARLTPGFEKRLSGRSLLGVYSVLALSLAAGAMLRTSSE